ncbi:hypothetical protein NST69_15645 [Paenibacillus sp. FSL P2-0089]|uniref:hypothetical protein n=1 Tax=Paenibacillus sp. FSL P2-0089 TaxID=2954526 RepID=UPI00315AF4F9
MRATASVQSEYLFADLLERMDNIDFVKQFASNPDAALREAGLEISLAELTQQLGQDQQLFSAVVDKLSNNVEFINRSNMALSSCDTPK